MYGKMVNKIASSLHFFPISPISMVSPVGILPRVSTSRRRFGAGASQEFCEKSMDMDMCMIALFSIVRSNIHLPVQ